MKYDVINSALNSPTRIITPLEPKRVPSVMPGLESLAALAADDGHSDAAAIDQAELYAAPEMELQNFSALSTTFANSKVVSFLDMDMPVNAGLIGNLCVESYEAQAVFVGKSGFIGQSIAVGDYASLSVVSSECFIDEISTSGVGAESDQDPQALLSEFKSFLVDNPRYFKDTAYELWLSDNYPEGLSGYATEDEASAEYREFLSENPDWVGRIRDLKVDPDSEMETSYSGYFWGDLEFASWGASLAFDHWFEETHLPPDEYSDDFESWNYSAEIFQPVGLDGGIPFYFAQCDGESIYNAAMSEGRSLIIESGGDIGDITSLCGFNCGSPSVSGLRDDVAADIALTPEVANIGTFPGHSVVSGGEVVSAEDVTDDHTHDIMLTRSNGSEITFEGGRVVAGDIVCTHNHDDMASHDQNHGFLIETAATEISRTELGTVFAESAGNLFHQSGHSMIVAFAVLSASEEAAAPADQSHDLSPAAHGADDVPHVVVLPTNSAHEEVVHTDLAPYAALAADSSVHAYAAVAHDVVADASVAHNLDATTMAKGVVAIASVSHGSGAESASVREPLPKI